MISNNINSGQLFLIGHVTSWTRAAFNSGFYRATHNGTVDRFYEGTSSFFPTVYSYVFLMRQAIQVRFIKQ